MRSKKTLNRKEIKEIIGNWAAVRVEHVLLGGPNIHEQYYFRYKGQWFPTTRSNLVKRGILKVGEKEGEK